MKCHKSEVVFIIDKCTAKSLTLNCGVTSDIVSMSTNVILSFANYKIKKRFIFMSLLHEASGNE